MKWITDRMPKEYFQAVVDGKTYTKSCEVLVTLENRNSGKRHVTQARTWNGEWNIPGDCWDVVAWANMARPYMHDKFKYHEPTHADNLILAAQMIAAALIATGLCRGIMWALEQGAWS